MPHAHFIFFCEIIFCFREKLFFFPKCYLGFQIGIRKNELFLYIFIFLLFDKNCASQLSWLVSRKTTQATYAWFYIGGNISYSQEGPDFGKFIKYKAFKLGIDGNQLDHAENNLMELARH